MINIHHHPIINDNNDNDISQSIEDVRYNGAGQREDRLINRRIVFTNNQYPVIFGQAEPLPAGGWKVVAIRYLINIVKCLGIVALFLVLLGVIHLASNTSSSNLIVIPYDEYESLIMKEKNSCNCSKTTTKDELSINNNDEIFGPMPYDETVVQDMFEDTEVIDDSTCALYDLFLHVFNKLCSLKDDIIAIKLGSAIDNKFDQNGAVPNKDNHPANVTIPPLNSSDLFVERNTT